MDRQTDRHPHFFSCSSQLKNYFFTVYIVNFAIVPASMLLLRFAASPSFDLITCLTISPPFITLLPSTPHSPDPLFPRVLKTHFTSSSHFLYSSLSLQHG